MNKKIDVRYLYDNKMSFWYDYQPMLYVFGNIAVQVDDEDYQGDTRVLYNEDGKIGFLRFGWGSCSGCDALQGCYHDYDELQQLCDRLQNDIQWFDTPNEALTFFKTHDWEGDYDCESVETKTFVYMCIGYLEGLINGCSNS